VPNGDDLPNVTPPAGDGGDGTSRPRRARTASDADPGALAAEGSAPAGRRPRGRVNRAVSPVPDVVPVVEAPDVSRPGRTRREIGRASCRERV